MDRVKVKLVFDRKGIADEKTKQGHVEIYVYDPITQKKTYITTGIELLSNQFKKGKNEKGKIVKHINAFHLNGVLDKLFRKVETFALSDKCTHIEDVKHYDDVEYSSKDLFYFLESELLIRAKSLSIGTYKHHRTVINKLTAFGKIVTFKDLIYSNIADFDNHMRDEGLTNISLYKNHSILRSYIKEAIKRDLLSKNPYEKFEPKKGKTSDPVFLTEEEILKIKNKDLSDKVDDKIIKVRDMFVFQCFTGMAYVDMKSFSKNDISKIDGHEVIRSNRIKTDERFIVVLLPDAKKILEKYDYNLPVISNQKYNDYLKNLAIYCEINKRITTHVGRHSFATYLLNKGVSMESVAVALGHSDLRMTQHYAKMLNITSVRDIVDNVLKKGS